MHGYLRYPFHFLASTTCWTLNCRVTHQSSSSWTDCRATFTRTAFRSLPKSTLVGKRNTGPPLKRSVWPGELGKLRRTTMKDFCQQRRFCRTPPFTTTTTAWERSSDRWLTTRNCCLKRTCHLQVSYDFMIEINHHQTLFNNLFNSLNLVILSICKELT